MEFAPGNSLVLVGRNRERLELAERKCRENSAAEVQLVAADLESGYEEIEAAARDVELVINAASATSRLRDGDLDADALGSYAAVDLVAPIRLVQAISKRRGESRLGVIFVSSLLAVVKSPNRAVYGGLKSAQEVILRQVMGAPGRRLLIVRVGTPLPTEEVTGRTVRLAQAARRAWEESRQVLFYGLTGRMLSWLYLAQPLIFRMVVETQRKFRRSTSP